MSHLLASLGFSSPEEVTKAAGIIHEASPAPVSEEAAEDKEPKPKKEKAPQAEKPPQTRGRRGRRRHVPNGNGSLPSPSAEEEEAVFTGKGALLVITGRGHIPVIKAENPEITAHLGAGEYLVDEKLVDSDKWLVHKSGYGNSLATLKKFAKDPPETLLGTLKIKRSQSATT